jgi:hypothetical protein
MNLSKDRLSGFVYVFLHFNEQVDLLKGLFLVVTHFCFLPYFFCVKGWLFILFRKVWSGFESNQCFRNFIDAIAIELTKNTKL